MLAQSKEACDHALPPASVARKAQRRGQARKHPQAQRGGTAQHKQDRVEHAPVLLEQQLEHLFKNLRGRLQRNSKAGG